jgi:uncharacterized protein (DUF2267 family)
MTMTGLDAFDRSAQLSLLIRGVYYDVKHVLPAEIRSLWPESRQSAA